MVKCFIIYKNTQKGGLNGQMFWLSPPPSHIKLLPPIIYFINTLYFALPQQYLTMY